MFGMVGDTRYARHVQGGKEADDRPYAAPNPAPPPPPAHLVAVEVIVDEKIVEIAALGVAIDAKRDDKVRRKALDCKGCAARRKVGRQGMGHATTRGARKEAGHHRATCTPSERKMAMFCGG